MRKSFRNFKTSKYILFNILFLSLSYFSYSQKNISGLFEHYYNDNGFSETILLELKKDSTFSYKEINDQICYSYTKISKGRWKLENNLISLVVDDSLFPKIEYKNNFEKKDTLTIKSFDDQGKKYTIWWGLYDDKNNLIQLPNYNNLGFKKEIPEYQKIKKIKVGNYFKFDIDEIKGDIIIKDISEKYILNFDQLKLLVKKNKLKSVKKVPGPTKKIRKVFKRIK